MPTLPFRQDNLNWSQPDGMMPTQLIPCDWQVYRSGRQKRRNKRRKRKSLCREPNEPVDCDSASMTRPVRAVIPVGDETQMRKYYERAFEAFQQSNCRVIAKAFVKFVEPRKQVKHPYNGRLPALGAQGGSRVDPELTKPKWWPAGVTHKEPDHLLKEGKKNSGSVHLSDCPSHDTDLE
jgi:hypothetical protein